MSSMNFSTAKQTIKPPQRGIFPLDHDSECKPYKEKYLSCLKDVDDKHHLCRELSKEYLQCRMDRNLMASEDLDKVCYAICDICTLFLCNVLNYGHLHRVFNCFITHSLHPLTQTYVTARLFKRSQGGKCSRI
jgi:cytochrome c oxidase assembly protein subunit 19